MPTKTKKKLPRRSVDSNGMPLTVPILGPEDMHKGAFKGPKNTFCLLGHVEEAFCGGLHTDPMLDYKISNANRKARDLAQDTILSTIKEFKDKLCGCPPKENEYVPPISIPSFNDDPNTPLGLLAAIWNKAMAKLGYVRGNPEAGLT